MNFFKPQTPLPIIHVHDRNHRNVKDPRGVADHSLRTAGL